jgi:hypothetical protein
MKEAKQYFVHSMKSIELLRNDIVRLQVKIDANVSRPRDEIDPITLGKSGDDATLWSDGSA